ncbi:MAG: acyl-CoA thioesterase [Saprospiraceae bacterium]
MYQYQVTKRVRYGETDQMGYIYYGNYALYYEIGRVELLRSLGLTYKTMEDDWGIMMPVVNMSTRYLRPGRYDDEITIQTQLRSLPGKDITFHFELYNSAKKLINGGRVSLCFIEIASNDRVPCPSQLLGLLSPHFE